MKVMGGDTNPSNRPHCSHVGRRANTQGGNGSSKVINRPPHTQTPNSLDVWMVSSKDQNKSDTSTLMHELLQRQLERLVALSVRRCS
jgi:hypothetical protein